MAITEDEFKEALSLFPSGVTVVTTKDADGELHGLTVSAFSSLSLNPPLILICIDKKTGSHHAFEECGSFIVNVLKDDQANLSAHFASPIEDKFAGIEFTNNKDDLPLLNDVLVTLECSLRNSVDGGDHSIFVGQIEKSRVSKGNPLIYCEGNYRTLRDVKN